MKKLICAMAAVSLILTGCGRETAIVENDDGAVVVVEKKSSQTLPKVRPKSDGKKNNTTSSVGNEASDEKQESTLAAGDSLSSPNGNQGEDNASSDNNIGGSANGNAEGGNSSGSGNTVGGSSQKPAVVTDKNGNIKIPANSASAVSPNNGSSQTTANQQDSGSYRVPSAQELETPDSPDISGKNNDSRVDVVPANGGEDVNHNVQEEAPEEDISYKPEDNVEEDIYYLEGIVYRNSSGTLLINEPDLSWVSVEFEDSAAAVDINIGDTVLITYDGYLDEGSPSEATDAYTVEVTRAAECEYELQRFVCPNETVDLKFAMLMPKNWKSSNIGYPTEGDFTDWGIRFMPEGEVNGLDISWHTSFSVREPYDVKPITVNGKKIKRYSRDNKWRFYVFDNEYIAANTFFGEEGYNEYVGVIEFMLETLEFDSLDFI